MDKRIIYKNPDNTVSIIVPSPNALKIMSIEDIVGTDGWKTKINARFNYLGNRWKEAMANKLNEVTQ